MQKLFLAPLSKAINRYLALDPQSLVRLKPLHGKIIQIELLPFALSFYCLFDEKGVELHMHLSREPDTIIRGTPIQFSRFMLTNDKRQAFFADEIEITGSAELGQQVVTLFNELEIDWEEYLSHWIGDIPTHHVSTVTKKTSAAWRYFTSSMTANIDEYLHEEKNWLPAREALADFFTDIDQLRLDADRLAAKIERIKNEAYHSLNTLNSY